MQLLRKLTWLLFSQLLFILPAYPHSLDFSPIKYLTYTSNQPSQSQPSTLSAGIIYHFEPTTSRRIFLSNNNVINLSKPIPEEYGKIAGAIFNSETLNPIEGATVLFSGTEPPSTASSLEHGQFLTTNLSPGEVTISITHPSYKPTHIKARVEAGKVTPIEAYLELSSNQVSVKISLLDNNQSPVAGTVQFKGTQSKELAVSNEGSVINLPQGRYVASIKAKGYLPKVQEIDISAKNEIQLQIPLTPATQQGTIPAKKHLKVILKKSFAFPSKSAKIMPAIFSLLDKFIDKVIHKPYIKIRVEGHTANRGSIGFKQTLSINRAKAVANYLVQHGIDRSKLSIKGLADSRPVVPNLTERGRTLNHRVEVLVVGP